MRILQHLFFAVLCGALLLNPIRLSAEEAKTYQVTGPVLEVTPNTITVQKGNEKWQLARDKNTKVNGDLKAGSKVTIKYEMVATEVTVKEPKGTSK